LSATKTLAFILKTQDYRDTSLLCHFYTRDFGKVHGIIKGIRETRARFGSTLEPFSLNEILFYRRRRGSDLHQVTQVELLDLFSGIREDLEKLSYVSYFIELLDEMVELEEPAPEIFDLLKNTLTLMQAGASARRCARIFEVKLFEILGLLPEIKLCVVCGTPEPEPAYFSAKHGGIQCKKCSAGTGPLVPVSRGTLSFLSRVIRSDVSELQQVKVSQEVGEDLEKMMRRFVDFQLARPLKTVVFLEKMGY